MDERPTVCESQSAMYLSIYLQFDRFNFSDESLVVIREERTDHVEHGVTEATDRMHGYLP